MKKDKLLQSLTDFLLLDDSTAVAPDKRTPEENVIINLVNEDRRQQSINPPEYIFQNLKARKISRFPEKKYARVSLLKSLEYLSLVAASVIFVIMISVISNPSKSYKNEYVQLEKSRPKFARIKKGQVIEKTGLKLFSREDGSISFKTSPNRNHIILKKGHWDIETDHTQLEKETWFHFPGGGVRPMGTRFSIQIENEKASVELIEGKIQTYSLDKQGNLESSSINSAPFIHDFPVPENNAAPEMRDDIINKAKDMVKDKDVKAVESTEPATVNQGIMKAEKKGESAKITSQASDSENQTKSVYEHFIGSVITVSTKNGQNISGILEKASGGKLQIRVGEVLQEIEEKTVTLTNVDAGIKKNILNNP